MNGDKVGWVQWSSWFNEFNFDNVEETFKNESDISEKEFYVKLKNFSVIQILREIEFFVTQIFTWNQF